MKTKIIYIGIFTAAFLLVTGAFIFLNSMYTNIFDFDFSPIGQAQDSLLVDQKKPQSLVNNEENSEENLQKDEQNKEDKTSEVKTEDKNTIKDLAENKANKNEEDKLVQQNEMNEKESSVKQVNEVKEENTNQTISIKEPNKDAIQINDLSEIDEQLNKVDSSYIFWTKKTAKMYEAMDADKAAKIIVNYSDNIAKDILYSMKRKKAAEILANLNPETASRITRAKNGF